MLARVHALFAAETLILNSRSVRAKRAGELAGPNPTDRGKKGIRHHVAVTGDGVPIACVATAADVGNTFVSERLFLSAFAVMATAANASRFGEIAIVFADKGYDAERHRELCCAFGAEPHTHKRRQSSGSGLGKLRWGAMPENR